MMIIVKKKNWKSLCITLALVGLMPPIAPTQVNVEDKASEKTPFELLWGFDTGG